MGNQAYRVVLADGSSPGWTYYQTTADIQSQEIYASSSVAGSRGGHVEGKVPIGKSGCEAHPRPGDRFAAHPYVWAQLEGGDDYGGRWLYCPICVCLVTSPHDGYVYLDYPAGWLPKD